MGEIKIVGTAHVSAKSVDEVREAIEQFHPDIVAVELDQGRSKAINKEGTTPSVDDVLELRNLINFSFNGFSHIFNEKSVLMSV